MYTNILQECLVADNALWALRTFVHPGCFLWEIKDKQSAFLQCLLPFSSQEMLDLPPTFLLLFLLPEQDRVSASQHHPKGTL